MSFANSIQFEVDESALNSFVNIIGSIRGEESIKILFIKLGTFGWKIDDMKIDLKKGVAELSARVAVEKNGEKLTGNLFSELVPSYDSDKKQIVLKAEDIRLNGIDFFDVGKVFSPKFKIPVNLKKEEVEIKLGKNNNKNIIIVPKNEKIEILEDRLVLSGELEFQEAEI